MFDDVSSNFLDEWGGFPVEIVCWVCFAENHRARFVWISSNYHGFNLVYSNQR